MAACDLNQLIEDSSCLNCLSRPEKEAVFIAYGAKALAELGGPDYTGLTELREAVSCWCVGGATLDSFMARVGVNAAVASGAIDGVPTISEIRDEIRCYNCGIGGDEMKAMKILIICSLLDSLVE